jgi:hypothetical protein
MVCMMGSSLIISQPMSGPVLKSHLIILVQTVLFLFLQD